MHCKAIYDLIQSNILRKSKNNYKKYAEHKNELAVTEYEYLESVNKIKGNNNKTIKRIKNIETVKFSEYAPKIFTGINPISTQIKLITFTSRFNIPNQRRYGPVNLF